MDFAKFIEALTSFDGIGNILMFVAVVLCVVLFAFFIVMVILSIKEKKKLKEVMGRRAKTKAAYAGEALARKALEKAEAQRLAKEQAEAAPVEEPVEAVEEPVEEIVAVEEEPAQEVVEEVVEEPVQEVVEEPVEEVAPVVVEEPAVVEETPVVASIADDEDESGLNKFVARYKKSFLARLIQSTDETKSFYSDIKNAMLSYKKTNSRISWHFDTINSGRNKLLKFAVRGKTLMLYLALDANDYVDTKYTLEAVRRQRSS